MKSKKCFAFIFARGGSKGLPEKNIKPLAGKPLIAYSIETALACPSIEKVVVSTDDEKIAAIAEAHGACVPFIRPPELATDKSAEWDSWKHAITELHEAGDCFDIFVSLPATSPLRSVQDVENCISKLCEDTDIVVTTREADRSPYFNMLKVDGDGYSDLVIRPDGNISRRQDAPVVYDMTTVAYVTTPDFIMNNGTIFDGRVRSVVVPTERAVDIDTIYDFKLAEVILKEGLSDVAG